MVSMLTACGGGGGGGAPAPAASDSRSSNPPSPGSSAPKTGPNRAPTISGTPPRAIAAGTSYSFTPFSGDVDGDLLTFAITGKPQWATFDAVTGNLGGTPTAADVGTTANIAITVSDGTATVSLAAFQIRVLAFGEGSALLSWMPPTDNLDGTPLMDLAGYRIYWGTSAGDYPNSVTLTNPGVTSYVVDNLAPANWYFVMTAVSAKGIESSRSNMMTRNVL
jgi:hypothetical protein